MIPLQRLWPRSARGRRLAAGSTALAVAALTSVSIFATGPAPVLEPRHEKAWPVSVLAVEPGPQSPTFTAYGRMESSRIAHLGTDLVARVDSVRVREGDWVAADEVLVRLDDAEVRLRLAERQADLAQQEAVLQSVVSEREMLEHTLAEARSMNRIAQDELARRRKLITARLISRSVLDEAVAEANRTAITLSDHERRLADLPHRIAAQQALVEKSRVLVELARVELAKTEIRAPFAGPVLAVRVAPGDRTGPGTVLIELADAAAFEVRVQVPASYESRFQRHLDRGTGVSATLTDRRRLELVRLGRQVRPGQSGLDAFFRVPADSAGRSPAIGRVVDMQIRLPEEPDVVALPVASLYENDRIYAVEDRRLRSIAVERVGELHTEAGEYRVLVRSPELADGVKVITTQLPKAVSGLLVEPS